MRESESFWGGGEEAERESGWIYDATNDPNDERWLRIDLTSLLGGMYEHIPIRFGLLASWNMLRVKSIIVKVESSNREKFVDIAHRFSIFDEILIRME